MDPLDVHEHDPPVCDQRTAPSPSSAVTASCRAGGTPIAAHGRVAYLAADGGLPAVTGDR